MKIAQISKHYFPITGGQQTYTHNLVDVFQRNNIESTVFQPYAPGAKGQKDVVVTSPIPILQRLDRYIRNLGWFVFNFELRFFKKKIAAHDILVSHYSFHYSPIRWHKKVIVLSHGVLWSTALKSFFDRQLHRKDLALKGNDQVFIVANDTDFIRRIGFDVPEGEGYFEEVSKNVWFIPNCIDDEFFSPGTAVVKEKTIIVPRNIRPDRGIDLAIKAFSILKNRRPEYKLEIIGGPTKGRYFDYCRQLVSTLELDSRVSFKGSCDWKSMRDRYRKATLTVIPTLEKEGTSLSALESMGCGTPVVGTRVAGLKDLPILKAEPTPEDLAQKISAALENLQTLRDSQYSSVKSMFNLRNWEKAWMNVIMKVAKSNHP